MFISYIDSTGTTSFSKAENYVLASVTIHEQSWYSINKKVEDLQLKYFPNTNLDQIEFHAKDMTNKHGIYEDMSEEKIFSILDDIFTIISDKDTDITIIAVLVQKSKMTKRTDLEKISHAYLFERLNLYIQKQNKNSINAELSEYGIMVFDTEGNKKEDQKLRDKLLTILKEGTPYSKLDCLIEDPFFTDSKWRNLIQIVDCVAYCIRKKYRVNTPSTHTANWARYYDMIETKFDSKYGKYYGCGLKIIPQQGD